MEYVGKISKAIAASCHGRSMSVFYLGNNVFSLGKIYKESVYKNK